MLRSLAVAGLVSVSLVLSACGSDADTSSKDATNNAASVFPVTVEHRLGETVVPAKPERVVVVGLTEQDILLELGIVPVATTEWYGEQPSAVWPWAQDLLGDAKPTVLKNSDGIQFEKIAELNPDLIIGTNSGVTKDDYAKLSKLAPTITNVRGGTDYFSAWQDQTRIIAEAVGLKEKGEELINRVDTAYAEAKKDHPEFAEMTATFSQGAPYDGILYVYPEGLGTGFLSELGFKMTAGLEKYAPKAGSQAEISAENLNLIDADVMVFATESADMFGELQRWSTIGNLKAVKENKAIYTDETLAGALYFLTPLSQMYVLEKLLPQLEKAAAGQAPREFPKA